MVDEAEPLTEAFEDDPVFLDISYKTGRVYQTSNREHYHKDGYEIYYLVTGDKCFYVNNKSYQLHSGDVMFIPPNTCHRSVWPGKGVFSNRTVCLFSEDFIKPVLEFAQTKAMEHLFNGETHRISLSTVGRMQFEILMKKLNDEMEIDDESYLCMCRMLVLELCVCLLRNEMPENKAPQKSRSEANIETVRDYIDRNYARELSLDGLAGLFFMNPSALSRSFKNATGQTIVSYITQRRMEKAKELLEQGAYSVTEVSDMVGFKTATYFERTFKKMNGLTPMQYKTRLKNA